MIPAAALAVPPPVGVVFVHDFPMNQVIRDRVPHGVVGSKGVVLGIGGAEIHAVPTVGGSVDEHLEQPAWIGGGRRGARKALKEGSIRFLTTSPNASAVP